MPCGVDRSVADGFVAPALQFAHLLGAMSEGLLGGRERGAGGDGVADELGAAPLGGDRRRVRRGARVAAAGEPGAEPVLVRRAPRGKLGFAPRRLGDDPAEPDHRLLRRGQSGGGSSEIADRYRQTRPGRRSRRFNAGAGSGILRRRRGLADQIDRGIHRRLSCRHRQCPAGSARAARKDRQTRAVSAAAELQAWKLAALD